MPWWAKAQMLQVQHLHQVKHFLTAATLSSLQAQPLHHMSMVHIHTQHLTLRWRIPPKPTQMGTVCSAMQVLMSAGKQVKLGLQRKQQPHLQMLLTLKVHHLLMLSCLVNWVSLVPTLAQNHQFPHLQHPPLQLPLHYPIQPQM